MENFFDLKTLIITLLKRLKFIIVLTVAFSLGWATLKFIPPAVKYITYIGKQNSTSQKVKLADEEQPYRYQARRTVIIDPIYISRDNTVVDVSYKVGEAYQQLYQNQEVLQPIIDEFYDDFKQDDIGWKQKMVACSYRTRSFLNAEYSLMDFYSSTIITVPTLNIVNIYITSNNKDLSENAVAKVEALLTDYVAKEVGSFKHTVTSGQLGFYLPEPSQGLVPISNRDLTATLAVGEKPTLSFIVSQTVKGGIYGALAGIALSIVLAFFINVVSLSIESANDLAQYKKRILLVQGLQNKKRFLGFIDKWIQTLGDDHGIGASENESYMILLEKLKILTEDASVNIIISSSSDSDYVKKFVEGISVAAKEYCPQIVLNSFPCINTSHETIQAATTADYIVLIEESGRSKKTEVAHELDEYNFLNKDILGFVLLT